MHDDLSYAGLVERARDHLKTWLHELDSEFGRDFAVAMARSGAGYATQIIRDRDSGRSAATNRKEISSGALLARATDIVRLARELGEPADGLAAMEAIRHIGELEPGRDNGASPKWSPLPPPDIVDDWMR
jgi:hypothetical protein